MPLTFLWTLIVGQFVYPLSHLYASSHLQLAALLLFHHFLGCDVFLRDVVSSNGRAMILKV